MLVAGGTPRILIPAVQLSPRPGAISPGPCLLARRAVSPPVPVIISVPSIAPSQVGAHPCHVLSPRGFSSPLPLAPGRGLSPGFASPRVVTASGISIPKLPIASSACVACPPAPVEPTSMAWSPPSFNSPRPLAPDQAGDQVCLSERPERSSEAQVEHMKEQKEQELSERILKVLERYRLRCETAERRAQELQEQRDKLSKSLEEAESGFVRMKESWQQVKQDLEVTQNGLIELEIRTMERLVQPLKNHASAGPLPAKQVETTDAMANSERWQVLAKELEEASSKLAVAIAAASQGAGNPQQILSSEEQVEQHCLILEALTRASAARQRVSGERQDILREKWTQNALLRKVPREEAPHEAPHFEKVVGQLNIWVDGRPVQAASSSVKKARPKSAGASRGTPSRLFHATAASKARAAAVDSDKALKAMSPRLSPRSASGGTAYTQELGGASAASASSDGAASFSPRQPRAVVPPTKQRPIATAVKPQPPPKVRESLVASLSKPVRMTSTPQPFTFKSENRKQPLSPPELRGEPKFGSGSDDDVQFLLNIPREELHDSSGNGELMALDSSADSAPSDGLLQ